MPQIGNTTVQNGGLRETTIRCHDGKLYVIVSYTLESPFVVTRFVVATTIPYNDSAWSDPLVFSSIDIDPDLFWDDDGTAHIQFSGIHEQTIETGALGPASIIWTGFSMGKLSNGS
jgi:beta-xylosidase